MKTILIPKLESMGAEKLPEEKLFEHIVMGDLVALQEMLRNNVQTYYGDESFPGLTVCAKSGTAEVGGDRKPNAMFTGFVADDKYPLAFIVAIEDGGYGRQVCVPILAPVLEACKSHMDG